MKSQIAQTLRGSIEYIWQGSGPVVLVCHGTSENCYSDSSLTPLLDAGFSLLTVSRPGYGRTPSGVGRSNTEAADALVVLLDQLEIPQCSVIAISGGGPTGVALAANYPERVNSLVLIAANTYTENRQNDPGYKSQKAFYGPWHGLFWGMLRLFSILSPRSTALQTLAIFSTHDPKDTISRLSPGEIRTLCHFFHGQSSREGALNDLTHGVTRELMRKVLSPTLIIHSREDASIPFQHAEWSLEHIPNARLCESGFTGHFYWIGPDYTRICESMIDFLRTNVVNTGEILR
ncbi:MAG: alpha/beta hydrolase [Anaerolineales bacterium]